MGEMHGFDASRFGGRKLVRGLFWGIERAVGCEISDLLEFFGGLACSYLCDNPSSPASPPLQSLFLGVYVPLTSFLPGRKAVYHLRHIPSIGRCYIVILSSQTLSAPAMINKGRLSVTGVVTNFIKNGKSSVASGLSNLPDDLAHSRSKPILGAHGLPEGILSEACNMIGPQ